MFIRASYNLSIEVDNQCENHLAQITEYIIIIFFFCNCGLSFTANSIWPEVPGTQDEALPVLDTILP